MRLHFYQPSATPWDWRTASTSVSRTHHAEMCRRLARWGHEVESFVNLPKDVPSALGPDNVWWRPLDQMNPSIADVIMIYAKDQCGLPQPVEKRQHRITIVAPSDVAFDPPASAEQFDREATDWNAVLYREVGGHLVSYFMGKPYGHPNHFIYAHPWEQKSRARWLSTVGEGQVVLDIGSAIGSWTLPAAAVGAKVYAFDPGTDAGMLRRLVTENRFDNRVEVIGQLVAECSGREIEREAIPWSSVPPEGDFGPTTTIAIDDFVTERKLERVDFIKVDTDGGEREVIAGMVDTLRRFRPRIVIEVHTFLGVTVSEIVGRLAQLGYQSEAVPLEEGYYWHVYGTPMVKG